MFSEARAPFFASIGLTASNVFCNYAKLLNLKMETPMKKAFYSLLIGLLAMAILSACATKAKDADRIKCPACNYEFQAPAQH